MSDKSGTVRVLFAVRAEVLKIAYLVAVSAFAANFKSTRVFVSRICSDLVSISVDAVAVGSAVVVTVPASGKK